MKQADQMQPMQPMQKSSSNTGIIIGVVVVVAVVLVVVLLNSKKDVALVTIPVATNTSGGSTNVLANTASDSKPVPVAAVGPLVGKFNADNYLSVKHNGIDVYSEQDIHWGIQHTVFVPNVKAGDRVDFVVRNVGGPGGFIGSFTWNGKTYNVNSTLFPGNKIITDTSPWRGKDIFSQYPNSQMLWRTDNCETCTHTFSWTAA